MCILQKFAKGRHRDSDSIQGFASQSRAKAGEAHLQFLYVPKLADRAGCHVRRHIGPIALQHMMRHSLIPAFVLCVEKDQDDVEATQKSVKQYSEQ